MAASSSSFPTSEIATLEELGFESKSESKLEKEPSDSDNDSNDSTLSHNYSHRYYCSGMSLPPSKKIADLSTALKTQIIDAYEDLSADTPVDSSEVAEWLTDYIVENEIEPNDEFIKELLDAGLNTAKTFDDRYESNILTYCLYQASVVDEPFLAFLLENVIKNNEKTLSNFSERDGFGWVSPLAGLFYDYYQSQPNLITLFLNHVEKISLDALNKYELCLIENDIGSFLKDNPKIKAIILNGVALGEYRVSFVENNHIAFTTILNLRPFSSLPTDVKVLLELKNEIAKKAGCSFSSFVVNSIDLSCESSLGSLFFNFAPLNRLIEMGFDFAKVPKQYLKELIDRIFDYLPEEIDEFYGDQNIPVLIAMLKNNARLAQESLQDIFKLINDPNIINLKLEEDLLELALNSIKTEALEMYRIEKYSINTPPLLYRIREFIFSFYPGFKYQGLAFPPTLTRDDPLILPSRLMQLFEEVGAAISIVNYPQNFITRLPTDAFLHMTEFLGVLPMPQDFKEAEEKFVSLLAPYSPAESALISMSILSKVKPRMVAATPATPVEDPSQPEAPASKKLRLGS